MYSAYCGIGLGIEKFRIYLPKEQAISPLWLSALFLKPQNTYACLMHCQPKDVWQEQIGTGGLPGRWMKPK